MSRIKEILFNSFAYPSGKLGELAGSVMLVKNKTRIKWTLSQMNIQPSDHVLEIGYGPGYALSLLAKITTDGFVAGTDTSIEMFKQAVRRNKQSVRSGKMELFHGSISKLDCSSPQFDKILAINSHPFWTNTEQDLKTLKGMLKPDGKVFLSFQPPPVVDIKSLDDEREKLTTLLETSGFCAVEVLEKPMKPIQCLLGIGSTPKEAES